MKSLEKVPALIVFRHAGDITPPWKEVNDHFTLPNGTKVWLPWHRISEEGKNQAKALAEFLPRWIQKKGYSPVNRVVTKDPQNKDWTQNPFDTVYPYIMEEQIMKVKLLTSVESLNGYIKDVPIYGNQNASTVICWDVDGLWAPKDSKTGKRPGEPIKNSFLRKLAREYKELTYPIKGLTIYVFTNKKDEKYDVAQFMVKGKEIVEIDPKSLALGEDESANPSGIDQIKAKLKDMFGNDFDILTLTKDQVDDLVKNKALTGSEGTILKIYLDKHKPSKQIPFPDLPEGQTLTPSEIASLPSIPELDQSFDSPTGDGDGFKPINFNNISAGAWTQVSYNINMLRGCSLRNLNKRSSNLVLLPKNKSLEIIFQRSQTSERFESRVTFESNMTDTLAMSAVGASAKLKSPWISGSASFNHSEENRKVLRNEALAATVNYELPIGKFDFSDIEMYIENGDEDKTTNSTLFKLNPSFVEDFTLLLNRFDKISATNPDTSLAADIEKFFEHWGDVIPLSVEFGLARYKTNTVRTTTEQGLQKFTNSFKTAVDGSYGLVSGGGKASFDDTKAFSFSNVSKETSNTWVTIGGSIPTDPHNPFTLTTYRRDPNSWSAMKFDNYHSVLDLLPQSLRNRIASYDNDIAFMSLFHQLEDNHLVQISPPPQDWKSQKDINYLQSVVASKNSYPYIGSDLNEAPINPEGTLKKLWVGERNRFTPVKKDTHQYRFSWTDRFSTTKLETCYLHQSKGESFKILKVQNTNKLTDNELFYVVPYRPQPGVAPTSQKFAIRNVASLEYLYVPNMPDINPPLKKWEI